MDNLEKLSDKELHHLGLNGKREQVLSTLYKRYSKNIYRYSLSLSKDPVFSEDLTQDVFLKAFSSFEGFKPKGDYCFINYLLSITHNAFVNYYRRKSKRLVNYVEDYNLEESLFYPSPEKEFIKNESHIILNKKVSELKPFLRDIVKLRYFHDLEYREIAELLELPIGTVKSRLFHANAKLRNIIKVD